MSNMQRLLSAFALFAAGTVLADPVQYQLTVTAAPSGTVSAVSGPYDTGTVVSGIAATPGAGCDFLQWSGDVPFESRLANPLSVTMDRPRTIVAHFVNPTTGVTRTRSVGGNWFDWATWSPQGVPGPKDAARLTGGNTLLPYPATVGSLMVTNSATTLTFTNWNTRLTAETSVAIATGANVTHAGCYRYPEDMSNRVHIVAHDLLVNGTINTDGRGYLRGRELSIGGPSINGQGPGRGFGSTSGGNGGGYGGRGAKGNPGTHWGYTYGSAAAPIGPGSGGGYGATHQKEGGSNGGGAVRIELTGTLTLNGAISANSPDAGNNWGGSGSGGAIWIDCYHLAGPAATYLSAKAGANDWQSGATGGGGRIALRYTTRTYQGTYNVSGGAHTYSVGRGQPGTYVETVNLTGSSLTVTASPAQQGAPTPYVYGVHACTPGQWITNRVASPTAPSAGRRWACAGWQARTGAVVVASGSTTQAVAQVVADTTLTFLWTNEYQLAVSAAPNGTATTAVNGWYTRATQVAQIAATPAEGFVFLQWAGDVPFEDRASNPLTLTMDRPRTIVAHFVNPTTGVTRTRASGGNWFDAASWSPQGVPGPLDTVRLTGGNTLLPYPATVASLMVTNTGTTLTFTNWNTRLTAAATVAIATGANVTHAGCYRYPEDMSNRVHIVAHDLLVNGTINTDTLGFYRGRQPDLAPYSAPGQGPGRGYGSSGGGGGNGGGYGGRGGKGIAATHWAYTYGQAETPVGPGSGGGYGAWHQVEGGGNGGGAVRIDITGQLTLNGTISANGTDLVNQWGGAGSGGAIWINCGRFAGPSGVRLSAEGGNNSDSNGGSGGGGRIALYYAASTYAGTYSVAAGTHPTSASRGSVGSYVEEVQLTGSSLLVQAEPDGAGSASPYPYGVHLFSPGEWVTDRAVTPTAPVAGVRQACVGWRAETSGVTVASGSTTQAVVQIQADTVLIFRWTNQYQLAVSAAPGGSVNSAINGYYTHGNATAGIQATPGAGQLFLQWSGDVPFADREQNPLTVTMDRPRTLVAHFVDPATGVARTRSTSGSWFDWAGWSPAGVPGPRDAVKLTGGTTLLPYPVTVASLVVTNSGTVLSFSNWDTCLTTAGDVTIATNATVTHAGGYRYPEDMSNRVHIVAQNVWIDGAINVDACGYFRGRHPDAGGPSINGQGPGRGVWSGGGNTAGGSGGGYGGAGGRNAENYAGGSAYGSATEPIGPGSGGAFGQDHGPQGGGNGGGSVRIEAAEIVAVNGAITANGQSYQGSHAGGGSGGAIWINCRRLLGPAGTRLQAAGGNGEGSGGGGGGGRIAVWYAREILYAGGHTVAGGVPGGWGVSAAGSVGTYTPVYDPPPQGLVIILR